MTKEKWTPKPESNKLTKPMGKSIEGTTLAIICFAISFLTAFITVWALTPKSPESLEYIEPTIMSSAGEIKVSDAVQQIVNLIEGQQR